MRHLILIVALLGLATACASSGSESALSDLRVCTPAAFDEDNAECTSDETGSALRAGRFYCSGRVGEGHEGETFRGRFLFGGEPLPENRRRIPDDVGNAWVTIFGGGDALPGGGWTCELRVGEVLATKAFESSGPEGDLLDLASCATADTTEAGPARVCDPDRASTEIAPTPAVTCSATFVRATGRTARLDLRYRDRPTDISLTKKLPLPVTAFGAQVDQRGGNLPSGPYECVFSLDGEEVARHAFRIGP